MSKTITKHHIAHTISTETGISKSESDEIVNNLIDALVDVTTESGKARIYSFGSFIMQQKDQRIGRNPKTKEQYNIAARKYINFKPANALKEFINDDE